MALQLDAAALTLPSPPSSLMLARQLLTHSRAEVRAAVWDLNADAGEERDLPARLRVAAQQGIVGYDAVIEDTVVTAQGMVAAVSGLTAHHLSRIVQEAAHNAVRHGKARTIRITLEFHSERMLLVVADDGVGFAPTAAGGAEAGHFGIQGMRERVRKIGGEFTIGNDAGAGTRVTVRVLMPGATA